MSVSERRPNATPALLVCSMSLTACSVALTHGLWSVDFGVGFVLTLLFPAIGGVLCALLVRDDAAFFRALGLLAVIAMVYGSMIAWLLLRVGVAGVFCSAIYLCVAAPPCMTAGVAVLLIRRSRDACCSSGTRGPGTRGPGTRLLILFAPPLLILGGSALEHAVPPACAQESLSASARVAAPIERVWSQSLSWSDRPDTAWRHLGTPLPIARSGSATRVGSVLRVQFAKGVVALRVTEVESGRLLVAEVIEQTVERPALVLRRVELRCVSRGPSATDVELRIVYQPRMRPRAYWRLFERAFGGLTLDYVVRGWREQAERERAPQPFAVRGDN